MVGRDHQQVGRAQRRKQLGEPGVESLHVRCVAGDIVAVSVLGIEIHEVGEDQSRGRIVRRLAHRIHHLIVVGGVDTL